MENTNTENTNFVSGMWSERVFVVTQDYEIRGYVFMPKTGRKNRVLSDILNGKKRFVAIKDCEVSFRNASSRKMEHQDFIQLNLNSIILLRPDFSDTAENTEKKEKRTYRKKSN